MPKNNFKKTAPVLKQETLRKLARIRKKVSIIRGSASLARLNNNPEALFFSSLPNVKQISTRGPITSDHLIRIKPSPVYIKHKNVEKDIEDFASKYVSYFDRHTDGKQTRRTVRHAGESGLKKVFYPSEKALMKLKLSQIL